MTMQDDANVSSILLALGRIEGTLSGYKESLAEFKVYVTSEFTLMKERLTEVERNEDRETGQKQGFRFAIDMIKMAPPAAIAFLLGKGDIV